MTPNQYRHYEIWNGYPPTEEPEETPERIQAEQELAFEFTNWERLDRDIKEMRIKERMEENETN